MKLTNFLKRAVSLSIILLTAGPRPAAAHGGACEDILTYLGTDARHAVLENDLTDGEKFVYSQILHAKHDNQLISVFVSYIRGEVIGHVVDIFASPEKAADGAKFQDIYIKFKNEKGVISFIELAAVDLIVNR